MKKIPVFIAYSFFSCIVAYSQPYALINPDRIAFFGYSDNYFGTIYNAIRIDSIKIDSSFTVYKNYSTFREDPDDYIDWDCVDIFDTSWIGFQIIKKPNGNYVFFNRWLDSILIKTQAQFNQNWVMCTFSDSTYFLATVIGIYADTILGQPDSVKMISIQKKSKTGNDITNTFNGKVFRIGKNSGFIRTYFLHKFPQDTVSRMLEGLTNPDIGINNLSVKSIFNYEVGDIFHYSKGSKAVWWVNGDEEMIKRNVIQKSYSFDFDTVFYTYLDSNIFIQYFDSLNDTSWMTIDTFQEVIPVRFILFDSLLPYESHLYDSSGNYYRYWSSMNYKSQDYNNRLKKEFYWIDIQKFDSCFYMMHADDCEYVGHYYVDGCGQRLFPGNNPELFNRGYWWGGFGGFICWDELRYFKKSTEEWGIPIVFPGMGEMKPDEVKATVSPNPFSEKAMVKIQGLNPAVDGYDLFIYDLPGKELLNYHSRDAQFTIGKNGLTDGIYFYKLYRDGVFIFTGKIIIE